MEQIDFLIYNYPFIRHLISIMIICRVIFKPTFMILGKYVELTVEEKDNKRLAELMNTKTYKMIAFIVDMLASVKLPKAKRKEK